MTFGSGHGAPRDQNTISGPSRAWQFELPMSYAQR
jgi:hypothetical protein